MTFAVQQLPDEQALAAAQRVLESADHVADPFASAEIFSAEAYTGDDFWRFEQWAVFEREWLCVGHVNQVPDPGDHFAITIIGESLVVTRDEAGDIHVLSAICQHRGHPLLDGLNSSAPGECRNAKLLVCPYHAWSYGLDGSLRGAPGMAETATAEELRRDIRLPHIRHTVFHGLIFINFDRDAAQLAPRLSKMEAMIDGYGLADLVPTATSKLEAKSNWKIYQENALEPYHTDVVHRTSHRAAPANLSAFYDYAPGDGAIMTTTGFADGEELFAPKDQVQLPKIAGLSREQQGRVLFIAVLPVLFLVFEPGSVVVNLALPDGAGAMTRSPFALFPQAATDTAGFSKVLAAQLTALSGIVAEDMITQEALQRGHASRFTPKGRLSWLETTIPQMNSWLLERYQRAMQTAKAHLAPGAWNTE
jgi:phenylpropionate dioxygenase-like ring-hydroxylating dioxygenase large terminal subunit